MRLIRPKRLVSSSLVNYKVILKCDLTFERFSGYWFKKYFVSF